MLKKLSLIGLILSLGLGGCDYLTDNCTKVKADAFAYSNDLLDFTYNKYWENADVEVRFKARMKLIDRMNALNKRNERLMCGAVVERVF